MSRKYYFLSLLIIVSALNFCLVPLPVKAIEDNKSFIATADSFIDQGDPDTNFGGYTYLNVGYRNNWTKSFIKFDLLKAPKDFHKAELRIAFRSIENSSLIEINETNAGWSEYSVRWNNSPSFGESIASKYISEGTQLHKHVKIDITDKLVNTTGFWSIGITLSNMSLLQIVAKEGAPPPTIVYYYQTSDLLMFSKLALVGIIGLIIVGIVVYNAYRVRFKKTVR